MSDMAEGLEFTRDLFLIQQILYSVSILGFTIQYVT